LKAGCNADLQNTDYGNTALHLAAWFAHDGVAEALLKAGCTSMQNNWGHTPLHTLIHGEAERKKKRRPKKEHVDVAETLLKAGFKPDIQDKEGNTALHAAACHGDTVVAVALLKANYNPDIQNKEGNTALDIAEQNKHG
jgi:ankyrin repeat protein